MSQPIEHADKLTPTKIAALLFRINLLPACIAPIGMFVLGGFQLTIKAPHAIIDVILTEILLLLGVLCEFVYYYQKKHLHWVNSKITWLYSMALNAMFIIRNARPFFSQSLSGSNAQGVFAVFLLLYPVVFFTLSSVALYKLYTYKAVASVKAELN